MIQTSDKCKCSPRCEDHEIFCGRDGLCGSCWPVEVDTSGVDTSERPHVDRDALSGALANRLGLPKADMAQIFALTGSQAPPRERDDVIQHVATVLLKSEPTNGAHAWGIARNQIADWWRAYHKANMFSDLDSMSGLQSALVDAENGLDDARALVLNAVDVDNATDNVDRAAKVLAKAQKRIDTALEYMRREAVTGEVEFTLSADVDAMDAVASLPHMRKCTARRCAENCVRTIVKARLNRQRLTASQRKAISRFVDSPQGEALHSQLVAA